jgi:hypothetical protein
MAKKTQCLTKQSIIVTIYVRYITAFLNVTNRIDGVMYPSGSTCLPAGDIAYCQMTSFAAVLWIERVTFDEMMMMIFALY